MNNSQQSQELENRTEAQESQTVKILTRVGLAIVVIGALFCIFSGTDQPILFVSGIILIAIGVFTTILAKFSIWWKFG